MSSNTDEADEVCASCGYCSVECQKNHRKQHKKACKKRAAEIRDDLLFTQPDESHLGECTICCLPLPLDYTKWTVNTCCCKRICRGCDWANKKREREQGLEARCPYCRDELPKTDEEMNQNYEKRIKATDPVALYLMGQKCNREGDYEGAVEYFTKAATLGDVEAHHNLSVMYHKGKGVGKDTKKKIYHLEEAAIGGHPDARFNLGNHERRNGMGDRAMKHYIITAKLGHDRAWEEVEKGFQMGWASKEDFEATLSGHQTAVDATESTQREEAENARQEGLNKSAF